MVLRGGLLYDSICFFQELIMNRQEMRSLLTAGDIVFGEMLIERLRKIRHPFQSTAMKQDWDLEKKRARKISRCLLNRTSDEVSGGRAWTRRNVHFQYDCLLSTLSGIRFNKFQGHSTTVAACCLLKVSRRLYRAGLCHDIHRINSTYLVGPGQLSSKIFLPHRRNLTWAESSNLPQRLSQKMAPKQGTLGYVKSGQTTLG